MSDEQSLASSLLKVRGTINQLSSMRLIVKKTFAPIDLLLINLKEQTEGSSIEVPKWAGEILVKNGVASPQEDSFDNELFNALSRERMQGPLHLSTLKKDFYVNLRSYLQTLINNVSMDHTLSQRFDKISANARDLISYRTQKLLNLASTASLSSELLEKITPEEQKIIEGVGKIISEWKETILGGI